MNYPNPETLDGEELNYWAGIAAGKEPFFHEGKYYLNTPNNQLGWRWNPIQDANQCLEISDKCSVRFFEWQAEYMEWLCTMPAGFGYVAFYENLSKAQDMFGPTELIARCRAVVAKWIAEKKS